MTKWDIFRANAQSIRIRGHADNASRNNNAASTVQQGHNSERCTSNWQCRQCGERHHFLICWAAHRSPQPQQKSSTPPSPYAPKGPPKRKEPPKQARTQASYSHLLTTTDPEPEGPTEAASKESEPTPTTDLQAVTTEPKLTTIAIQGKNPHAFLMTRRLIVSSQRDRRITYEVPALFNPGSQTSYISDALIKKLRPHKVTSEEMEVHGFGGKQQEPMRFNSPIFSVRFRRMDNAWEEIMLNRTEQISRPFGMTQWTAVGPITEDEDVRDAMMFTHEEPEILIGARHFWKFFKGKREVSPGLFVILTTLGPLINGETEIGPPTSKALSLMTIHDSNIEQMPTINEVEHFFKLESLGIMDDPSADDDKTAMQLFNKSVRREPDGRYSVKWPWKETNPDLPSNLRMAHTRLASVITRLRQMLELYNEYEATIKKQLVEGIIEPAEKRPGTLEHYLPHHGVVTKRLRIVYDASAHARGTASLNSCLYRGPVLLPDLVGLFMRFRCPAVPVLADIQAAFLMIALEPEDREVTKFLWLKDITKPLTPDNLAIFRFRRVAFGVISSPFLLAATLQHHLQNYNSPVSKELAGSLYVDNALLECETTEEAITKCREAKAILKDAHFNLREFISNYSEVAEAMPEEDSLDKAKAKVLGLKWDVDIDEIIFNFPTTDPSKPITRRLVLSHLASLFDPLGLLSPCILPAKLIFQELWKLGHGWDDLLSPEDATRWATLQESWKGKTIRLPRRAMDSKAKLQLHAFVDASSHTFAAAVYLRGEAEDKIQAWLIFSKNRLKPKKASKARTIPRMELLAILIGVRALRFTKEHLHRDVDELHLWSDSQIALSWVKSPDVQPVFVERRLKEIRERPDTIFHYVRTDKNPADLATRGTNPEELRNHSLWWHGPTWLQEASPQ